MGKYVLYGVLASFLVLVSFFFASKDDKKELVVTEKESIKSLKDETFVEKTSKVEIVTIDKNSIQTSNLSKSQINSKIEIKKRFIISKTSSRKDLFQISLFSYKEFNQTNKDYAIGGSVDFEESKDFYSLRFNEELLKYADKLYIEVTYNTRVFKTNAFRLYEIDKEYLYGVDIHLEDDFINLHPYELSKRTKFKLEDIIPKDINLTHHMDNTTIESDNIKELNFMIKKQNS